ncbi:hypothetical protein N0V88_003303 [Collariella sp. IMI 366227]|nr:hypothetical protein N0V88_003303 [Collariella sp. IMI 366227]
MASRSGSEEKKPRRQQAQTYESEGEESEDYAPRQRSRRRGKRQQQQQGGGPLDSLALGNVQQTAGGLVNGATGALGGVAGQAVNQQQQGGGGGKSDTLKLRLDLNLDIEITLKAKIHGDLELALFPKLDQSSIPSTDRPSLPAYVGAFLVGKQVDEDGDIVDPATGQVLAHAAGDLPAMVGRTVSNTKGDILGRGKENPSESPSDIFLDVKSTREGIQLTIRIPTVFNGQQTTPHISFS